jgi:hypothetical protein
MAAISTFRTSASFINILKHEQLSQYRYCAAGWMSDIRFPAGGKEFFSCTTPIPGLSPTQPPIQRVPVALSQVRVADNSPPSRAALRMRGTIPPLSHESFWRCDYFSTRTTLHLLNHSLFKTTFNSAYSGGCFISKHFLCKLWTSCGKN